MMNLPKSRRLRKVEDFNFLEKRLAYGERRDSGTRNQQSGTRTKKRNRERRHHNTKTGGDIPVEGIDEVAIRTTQIRALIVERTAAQHPRNVAFSFV
jgi:hypothetical protein